MKTKLDLYTPAAVFIVLIVTIMMLQVIIKGV